MGVSEDEIRAALDDEEDKDFGIWPENVATLQTFMSLKTQWRVGPLGGFLGLDYPGVQAALALRRVKKPGQVFEDLQAMERAALEVLNKRND